MRNKTVSKSLVKISTIFAHSCRDETRLAIFSVPFPPKKVPNVFLPVSLVGGRNCPRPDGSSQTEAVQLLSREPDRGNRSLASVVGAGKQPRPRGHIRGAGR